MIPAIVWAVASTAAALVACGWGYRLQVRLQLDQRERAELLRLDRVEFEAEKAQTRLAAIEALEQQREALDQESRRRHDELAGAAARLAEREQELERRSAALVADQAELESRSAAQQAALERISGLSAAEARALLLRELEEQARHDAAVQLRALEDEARREGDKRARQIVTLAIERCAVEQATETSVSVVPLPSDEVKGRIIGREGRNIRTFEQLTGVDLVIDDTPEAVVLSGFDPRRREVARLALSALVADGRIHPARIEEVVERAQRQVAEQLTQAGEQATFATGVPGLPAGLVELLGKLSLRTSYGQNVLAHSVEVAHLVGVMAAELGLNVPLAKRAALLHDLGKAVDFEVDGPHALIGRDLARTHGESAEVCAIIAAHHRDEEAVSPEAVLVSTADAISAARPGARRDSLESYIQRLSRLEELAHGFPGVDKAYAIQAGREVRIIVAPEAVDDADAASLAREIATKIESDLAYPGQIKVTVIREQRAIEYAR